MQHTVREPSGGGSHVHADCIRQGNGKALHGLLQLETAAADVLQGLAPHLHVTVLLEDTARLIFLLIIHIYDARQDQSLRLLPGRRQPPLRQQDVQSLLQV